jgi:hypothetical protein
MENGYLAEPVRPRLRSGSSGTGPALLQRAVTTRLLPRSTKPATSAVPACGRPTEFPLIDFWAVRDTAPCREVWCAGASAAGLYRKSKWISRAADQGFVVAQFALGEMYALGQGVPEDAVLAHKWFNLSGAQAARITGANKLTHRAAEMRDALARTMSPAQIEEAQKLAREWKPNSERD